MKAIWAILLVAVLVAACGGPGEPGLVVILAADAPDPIDPALMQEAARIVAERLDGLGVARARVTVEGTRLRVELPPVEDVEPVIHAVKQPGLVTFWDSTTAVEAGSADPKGVTPVLTGAGVAEVSPYRDPATGWWGLELEFTPAAAETMARLTEENIGRFLVMSLDGVVITAPVIQSAIPDGRAVLALGIAESEARELAVLLRTGAVPVPLAVESAGSAP
jgi:preprotein translocase subunit SecD